LKLQQLYHHQEQLAMELKKQQCTTTLATLSPYNIDLTTNAYDYVLGCYARDFNYSSRRMRSENKKSDNVSNISSPFTKAKKLLEEMLHYQNQHSDNNDTIAHQDEYNIEQPYHPPPSESSFVYTFQAINNHENVYKNAQELLDIYEGYKSSCSFSGINSITSTTTVEVEVVTPCVYNAVLELYTNSYMRTPLLLPRIQEVMKRIHDGLKKQTSRGDQNYDNSDIERTRRRQIVMEPDETTYVQLLRACSLVPKEDSEKGLILAKRTFEMMSSSSQPSTTTLLMTEKSYFYMMKCLVNLSLLPLPSLDEKQNIQVDHRLNDNNEKDDNIDAKDDEVISLFKECANDGLVGPPILLLLQQHCSSESKYRKIVGNGRLPHHWIANCQVSGSGGGNDGGDSDMNSSYKKTRKKKNQTQKFAMLYTDGTRGGENKHTRRKGKSTSNWLQNERKSEVARVERKEAKTQRRAMREK